LGPLRALRASQAREALRALRASQARKALGASRTRKALGALRTNRASRASRAGRACGAIVATLTALAFGPLIEYHNHVRARGLGGSGDVHDRELQGRAVGHQQPDVVGQVGVHLDQAGDKDIAVDLVDLGILLAAGCTCE